ncbi:MAG: TolC family protein [Longimicrobiales bacterium]|nr:TolC family protein [Longimicrobiales bacterium]
MRFTVAHSRGLAGLVLSTLAGCSMPPAPETVAPVDSLPAAYPFAAEEGLPGESLAADSTWAIAWWESFEDPALNRLMDAALDRNFDLAEAVARVEEARARLGIATADLLPQLTGTLDATRSSTPNNSGFGRQIESILGGTLGDSTGVDSIPSPPLSTGPDRFTNTNYTASVALSYEVDIWGRIRRDRAAALNDLLASEEDLRAVRLGVLAETIRAWFEVLDLTQREVITREIVDVLEERVDLAESRYAQGLTTSFELYDIRQDLTATATGLPQITAQLAEARRALALLTGRFQGDLHALLEDAVMMREEIDAPAIPVGIPADVLAQRPDVRAERRRLEATRLRVGARRADLLPSITLTGSVGLQSSEASNIFDLTQWFNNLAAGLTAPLFQGGRLRANIAVAEAQYHAAVASYGRAVLTAVGEVEAALRQYRAQQDRVDFVVEERLEADAGLAVQSDRFAAGVGGYTDYLDALRNQLSVRSTAAEARRDLALARLAVHRAVGGTWVPSESSNSTER